eukprot:Skav210006  [mRNA]  locus=scaffold1212:12910:13377:- [translate_table: standard]
MLHDGTSGRSSGEGLRRMGGLVHQLHHLQSWFIREEGGMAGPVDVCSGFASTSMRKAIPRATTLLVCGSGATQGTVVIPWAVGMILEWICRRLEDGGHMEKVDPPMKAGKTVVFWTDAKAKEAWIGGWKDEGEGPAKNSWFSMKVTEAALELLSL